MNEIEPALRRAYALGQKYWQQADSDSDRDHRKADETQAKFNQLVESMTTDTLQARRAQPAREPLTSQQVWENHEIMSVNAMLMEDLMRIVRAVEAAHGITQKDAG